MTPAPADPRPPERGGYHEARQILHDAAVRLYQHWPSTMPVVQEAAAALTKAAQAVYGLADEPITPERVRAAINHDPMLRAVYHMGYSEGVTELAALRAALEEAWHRGYDRGRQHGREEAERDESRRGIAEVHARSDAERIARRHTPTPTEPPADG